MKKVLMLAAVMLAALAAAPTAIATGGPPEKVTICHVAGRADDPANYITLTLPWVAVYGQAGHFNENGTPQAGHEQDSLGACSPPPPFECPNGDLNGDLPGCDAPPPECPNGDRNGEAPGCDASPPPPGDRCPPGEGPFDGKDGMPGNEECCPDANNDQKCDEAVPLTGIVTLPPPTTPTPEEPVTPEPPAEEEPEVEKPEKSKAEKPEKSKAEKPEEPKVEKPRTSTTKTEETLPHTGLPLGVVALLGAASSLSGLWLRRRYPK